MLSDREFNRLLTQFRPHFAHKAVKDQGDGVIVIDGKFGRIYPYSLDGEVLGLNYTGFPDKPPLSGLRLSRFEQDLKPFVLFFEKLDWNEYEATFPIENLLAVAKIIRVPARRKASPDMIRRIPAEYLSLPH